MRKRLAIYSVTVFALTLLSTGVVTQKSAHGVYAAGIKRMDPAFHGSWIRKEFYDSVVKNQTPAEIMMVHRLEGLSGLTISGTSDTIQCSVVFNEGMDLQCKIVDRRTLLLSQFETAIPEFVVTLLGSGRSRELVAKNMRSAEQDSFIPYPEEYSFESMPYAFVNDHFFVGTYADIDSGREVTFDLDGSLKGFPDDYAKYNVQCGFGSSAHDFDCMFLYHRRGDRHMAKIVHWSLRGDTLSLFDVIEKEVPEIAIGKRIMRLVKHH